MDTSPPPPAVANMVGCPCMWQLLLLIAEAYAANLPKPSTLRDRLPWLRRGSRVKWECRVSRKIDTESGR